MESDGLDRILLKTYLPSGSRQRLARIEVGVRLVSAIEALGEMTITEVTEEGWQDGWKSNFELLRIGKSLVIKPTWIDYVPQPMEVVVEIDPGMAFGTGYHPTTHACLEALEQMLKPGASVLDLGTGSGILAIAAVRLGASNVVAMDIDPQAVRAARQNLRRTRTLQKAALVQGTLPHPRAGSGQFDFAVANISARAICDRAPFIVSALGAKGTLIASGMMQNQAQDVLDTMVGLGYSTAQEWIRDEWVTLAFQSDSR